MSLRSMKPNRPTGSFLLFLFAWLLAMPGAFSLSADIVEGMPVAERTEANEVEAEGEAKVSFTATRRSREQQKQNRLAHKSPKPTRALATAISEFRYQCHSRQANRHINLGGGLPIRV